MTEVPLEPAILLNAYTKGWFPMADEDGVVQFYGADPRAVFPLNDIKPSKRTRRILRESKWHVTRDQGFEAVIRACAAREETWINDEIIDLYGALHRSGAAHSVEVWVAGELVGGLYGVAIGGAFFGESMFNHVDHASRVAFYHLIEHLRSVNFVLLDSQFINPFTQRLGAVEIPLSQYQECLSEALQVNTFF